LVARTARPTNPGAADDRFLEVDRGRPHLHRRFGTYQNDEGTPVGNVPEQLLDELEDE
jgi:hypothetical protein